MCTRTEIQEMLNKQETHMKEYVLAFFQNEIKQLEIHKTAPETEARLDKLESIIETIVRQNEEMQPILQGLHDTFVGGKMFGRISTVIVKFLITVTAISGSILWLKDWVKK